MSEISDEDERARSAKLVYIVFRVADPSPSAPMRISAEAEEPSSKCIKIPDAVSSYEINFFEKCVFRNGVLSGFMASTSLLRISTRGRAREPSMTAIVEQTGY